MTGPHPASDAMESVRRSQDRDYAAEGIPMLLTLISEVAPIPDPGDAARTAGLRLAEQIERDRAVLAPTRMDADLGVVITLLQAAALADFAVNHGTETP